MLFNSYSFLLFFPIVTFLYFIIPNKYRYIWLLISSYFFYMSWNFYCAIIMLVSSIISFLGGIFIERKPKYKFFLVVICIILNLAFLIYFKYVNFIGGTISRLLQYIDISFIYQPFEIIMPLGISFYTFQVIGYLMDVYNNRTTAEKNFFRYALFVSFFPKLIAGPIERANNFLRQIDDMEKINVWEYDRVIKGLILIIWGLFMKMVIADRATIFVDTIFSSFQKYGSYELLLASILYTIQIYCDFASYSIIAIGTAKIMGFQLVKNFNMPYFSCSIKEFWNRWHISLSTWLRDYVYIPLGGSRCSKTKKYRNIILTFIVSGIWHGASLNFIFWGMLHGIYLIIEDLFEPIVNKLADLFKIKRNSYGYKLWLIFYTFVLVNFAWIFFRMASLRNGFKFINHMLKFDDPWVLFNQCIFSFGLSETEFLILLFAITLLVIIDLVQFRCKQSIDEVLMQDSVFLRWSVLVLLIFSIIIFGVYGPLYNPKQFIYFKF